MTRAVALIALLCGCAGGCTARALVVPGPGDGSRDFSVVHGDLAGADLAGADLSGSDLSGLDLGVDLSGPDMQPVPLPQHEGASVGTGIVVLAADLDGDGDQDLVVVEPAGTVRIYNGNGKGALFPRQAFEINTNTTLATGMLADVDADGVLDLVLAEPGGVKSEVDVLRGNGDATFADWSRTLIPGGVSAVAVGDLDGDGTPDLVATTQDDLLHVLRGMKGGKPQLLVPTYSVGDQPTQLSMVDLDGDGHLDVVETDRGGTSFITGDGMFDFAMNTTVPIPMNASRFVLGDWNSDGIPDVASAGTSGTAPAFQVALELIEGDGTGGVQGMFARSPSFTSLSTTVGLASGDLDGDGLADLVVSANGAAVIEIEYGADGFASHTTIPADEGAVSLALADFDNDGHLDVAAAGATKTQLYLTQP